MLTSIATGSDFADQAVSAIQAELNSNEELLWADRPSQGLRLRSADILMLPFSVIWLAFACFWELSATSTRDPFFVLWGIPFILVGNYFVWGRFIMDAWQRRHVFYGVSDKRIIIISGLRSRNIKSLNLRTLSELSLQERANDRGTIIFGASGGVSGFFRSYGSSWPNRGPVSPAFEMIANAREVYNLIRNTQNNLN